MVSQIYIFINLLILSYIKYVFKYIYILKHIFINLFIFTYIKCNRENKMALNKQNHRKLF